MFLYFSYAIVMKMKKLPTIVLERKVIRGNVQLCITCPYNEDLLPVIRSLKNVYWNRYLQFWQLPFNDANLSKIEKLFSKIAIVENKISKKTQPSYFRHSKISNLFYRYLEGKRYSQSTCDTYGFFIRDFLKFYSDMDLTELDNRCVELFIESAFLQKNYSISTQRQFISALKLFVIFYPETQITDQKLSRPKKSKILPTVLSQEEVLHIIQVTKNLKHRVIITLLYSSGLRVGEVIRLRLRNIDLERMQIKIVSGKGRKDRYVSVAHSLLPLLRNYLNTYRPNDFLIEGLNGGMYSASSIRKFLIRSVQQAGIQKKVTAHTFRHSYATHLLENGVGLRHIQELLGHAKPETTMIYTHVTRKSLLDVQSPLDTILLSLNKNDKNDSNLRLSGRSEWI